jgi:DnaJ-class molecular chaperone
MISRPDVEWCRDENCPNEELHPAHAAKKDEKTEVCRQCGGDGKTKRRHPRRIYCKRCNGFGRTVPFVPLHLRPRP